MSQLLHRLFSQSKAADKPDPFADRPPLLDYATLEERMPQLQATYLGNKPFPHIVIDDFLRPALAQALVAQYPPDQDRSEWISGTHKDAAGNDYVQKDKKHLCNVMAMPAVYRDLILELNARPFLDAMTHLTGIRPLIADADLLGAGIHQISRGGLLKIHADFASHQRTKLDRRLNFLLYLNPAWKEAWGGHLELWDENMQGPPVKILPVLNRCVIFTTTAKSFHGHPHPLSCPEGVFRKSLALYYYTNGRPAGEAVPGFETHWRDVPAGIR